MGLAANRYMSKAYPAVFDPADDVTTTNLIVTHPDYAVTTARGGDVPGTTDVVMQPEAAIEGEWWSSGRGNRRRESSSSPRAPIPIGDDAIGAAGGGGIAVVHQ